MATPAQSFAERDIARHRANGDLALATWKRLSDLRLEHAQKLKLEGVIGFPPIAPSREPDAFRELRQRIREEGENARAVCDHVLQALDEQATEKKSIEWLAEKSFTEGGWRTARGTILKPKRKPAAAAAPSAPLPVSELTPEERRALAAESWTKLYGKEPT